MSRAADAAYKIIREQIISGSLPPSTQLREEELARLCGVSRTPVRDALHRLEAELLVRRTETQRTFVQHWSEQELADLFAVRRMLEADAASRAAQSITPDEIGRLKLLNEAIEKSVSAPGGFDRMACLSANLQFHRTILQASRSERLVKLHGQLVKQATPQLSAISDDFGDLLRSLSDHQELIVAFTERDCEWARSLMDSHIHQSFRVARQEVAESMQSEDDEAGTSWASPKSVARHRRTSGNG